MHNKLNQRKTTRFAPVFRCLKRYTPFWRQGMKNLFIVIAALIAGGCNKVESKNDSPEIVVAKIVSNGDKSILDDVQLYLSNKQAYKAKHKDGLEEYGFDGAFEDSFDFTFVITQSLKSINRVAVVDWREDAQYVFNLLNDISENTLSKCSISKELAADIQKTQSNISYYLESHESGFLFSTCAKNVGLEIIGIDDGTDSFVLSLVPSSNVAQLREYSQQLKLKINIYGNGV